MEVPIGATDTDVLGIGTKVDVDVVLALTMAAPARIARVAGVKLENCMIVMYEWNSGDLEIRESDY